MQVRPQIRFASASNSKVGLRTATPVLDVHANTTDTPAIRLEQNNTGGFTAQTWDIAGNEANFFVRDVTSGSRLPFASVPAHQRARSISQPAGNVGIGTASPTTPLDISGHTISRSIVATTSTNTDANYALRSPFAILIGFA